MQHQHIEVIKRPDMQYLRMTRPPSKGHSFPIVTMPWAVKVYERIYERHKRELGHAPLPDDYVFLPEAASRDFAIKQLVNTASSAMACDSQDITMPSVG